MDDTDSLPLIPTSSENGLIRAPSEHELSISRSLQKLDLPDWFKNSSLSRHESRERLFGAGKKPRWADLRQKSTSTSSLPVITRPSTPGSRKNMATPTMRYNYNCTPTSPSPASSPFTFSRRTSKDELGSGQYFQYPSTSTPPGPSRCTSPFVNLGGFNYSRPYTGWRSSERLARDYAVENEDDIKSYDHSYVNSSGFYWAPEERLSHGPGYFAMKFGIHPGIFNKHGSCNRQSNFDEQLSRLMTGSYKQSNEDLASVSGGDKVASAVEEIGRMMSDSHDINSGRRFIPAKPEIIDVVPKLVEHVATNNGRHYLSKQTVETELSKENLADVATKPSAFVNIAGTKLAQPWATTNIRGTTFPTLFYEGSKEAQAEWDSDDVNDEISAEIAQLSIWKDLQLQSMPFSTSSPNPNEFQPIIYDLSMIDSATASALGLPVIQSSTQNSKLALQSPSTDSKKFNIPTHQKISTESELNDSDDENDGYDNENGNAGDNSCDESEENLPKFPIYPPSTSPLLGPKVTTTTVTKRDGRIAEIVEIPTDSVSSSSKQSSISFLPETSMFLPLRMSTVQTVSITTSSGSSMVGSGSSCLSPNRPTLTPLTTTTFIATFHKDNVLSPSQPPEDSIAGKTRTLILLNEGSTPATSPKMKSQNLFRPIASDGLQNGEQKLSDSKNGVNDAGYSEIFNSDLQFEMIKMSNDEKFRMTTRQPMNEAMNGHGDRQSNSGSTVGTSETKDDAGDDLLYDSPVMQKTLKWQNDIKISLSENSSTEEVTCDSSIASVELKSEAEIPFDSVRTTRSVKRTSSKPLETSSKCQSNLKVLSHNGETVNDLSTELKSGSKLDHKPTESAETSLEVDNQNSNGPTSIENQLNSSSLVQKMMTDSGITTRSFGQAETPQNLIETQCQSDIESIIKEASNDIYNSSVQLKIVTDSDKSIEKIQSVSELTFRSSVKNGSLTSDEILKESQAELKNLQKTLDPTAEINQINIVTSRVQNNKNEIGDFVKEETLSNGALKLKKSAERLQDQSETSQKHSKTLYENSVKTNRNSEASQKNSEASQKHTEITNRYSEKFDAHSETPETTQNRSVTSPKLFETKDKYSETARSADDDIGNAIKSSKSDNVSENRFAFERFNDISLALHSASRKGVNTQLSLAETSNQSVDSFSTADTHANLISREYSTDMSIGTIVHRIGYQPRGNVTDTSIDDLASEYDTGSIVRMRMPTDEQRKVRRNVRSDLLDESVIVKCHRISCKHSSELRNARVDFKTCSNCYTYYCSHACRKEDKERHRRQCLHERSRHVCKLALGYVRENEDALGHLSKIAKDGAARLGEGYVRITLPSTKAGLKFIRRGFERLEIPATYLSVANINVEELGEDACSVLQSLCGNYDVNSKFVLLVTMFINKEVMVDGVPHWERNIIAKCAKLRLPSKYEVEENNDGQIPRPRSRLGSAGSTKSQKSWRWSWT